MIYIRRLIWDDWNVGHIARHQVTPDIVEEVWRGDYIMRESNRGRIMLIGPANSGRVFAVVLDPLGDDTFYVVTARPADRKERRVYREEKGSEG
jgi:uncharacterized protein